MGELTEVASAKRAVRGVFNDSPDEELEDVRDRTSTRGSFSSPLTDWELSELCKIGAFDMLVVVPVLLAYRRPGLVRAQLLLDSTWLDPFLQMRWCCG